MKEPKPVAPEMVRCPKCKVSDIEIKSSRTYEPSLGGYGEPSYFAWCKKCGNVIQQVAVPVAPEPAPIDTGHPYDQSDLDDSKPDGIKLTLTGSLGMEDWQSTAYKQLNSDQAEANRQLQPYLERIESLEQKLVGAELLADISVKTNKRLEAMMLTDFEVAGVFSEMLLADGTYCDCKTCVSTIAKLKLQGEQYG
jgi:hypothetical protein